MLKNWLNESQYTDPDIEDARMMRGSIEGIQRWYRRKLMETKMDQELELGIEVEFEHTDDPKEAEKIAKEHLAENPKYYSKLYKAGLIDEPKAIKIAKSMNL